MPSVRIAFIRNGQIIRRFDRAASNEEEAKALAYKITTETAIGQYDSISLEWERKCVIKLFRGTRQIEHLESRAIDEAQAIQIAKDWAALSNISYDHVVVTF